MDEFEKVQPLHLRVNLEEKYPRELRSIIKRSFLFIIAPIFLIGAYFLNQIRLSQDPIDAPLGYALDGLYMWLLIITGIIALIKLIYEILYHVTYSFSIEGEHFTITKGILFRSRAAFPIARINDVGIQRTPLDMIFFLYTINILTASPVATEGRVSGLSKVASANLQAFLLTLVESTLPDVKERAVNKILEEELPPEEADKLIHPKKEENQIADR